MGEAVAPIRQEVMLAAPPADAFATFADLGRWWPHAASWSGDVLEGIGIEPRVGGFCWERGPYGMRLDWGRVLSWEPPQKIVFTWQVSPSRIPEPNPARASEVVVTFSPVGTGTRVALEHRAFERHGDAATAAAYRDRMTGEGGWPTILERYAAAVQRRSEAPWEGLTT